MTRSVLVPSSEGPLAECVARGTGRHTTGIHQRPSDTEDSQHDHRHLQQRVPCRSWIAVRAQSLFTSNDLPLLVKVVFYDPSVAPGSRTSTKLRCIFFVVFLWFLGFCLVFSSFNRGMVALKWSQISCFNGCLG